MQPDLPVIDLSDPAFALTHTDAELAALRARYVRELRMRDRLPRPLLRLVQRWYAARSELVRGAMGSGVMPGIATYRMKLPPALQRTRLDQKLAAMWPPVTLRYRLREVARLLAEDLPQGAKLVNLGGGPALDSLNALKLAGVRGGRVYVLDRDAEGPRFGAQAAPRFDAELVHVPYDWRDTAPLRTLPRDLAAGSSEGALFDYASDDEIVANLRALHEITPPHFRFCGDVVEPDATTDASREQTGLAFRTLGVDGLRRLAERAGFRVDKVVETIAVLLVRLAKA